MGHVSQGLTAGEDEFYSSIFWSFYAEESVIFFFPPIMDQYPKDELLEKWNLKTYKEQATIFY